MPTNYLFLLGGHDLEMITIRQLLEEQQLDFIDRNLAWGASWSDYEEIIDSFDWEKQILVGIELSGEKPANALLIDHHNELSNEPASIEQVARMLGLTLSRHELLVAANDKGYIPAMKTLGASEEEIHEIRRLDRKAQGVTDEMEAQAEKDIRLINKCGKVSIVRTGLPKFSPIADRLHQSQLLVYNSSELTYYGKNAASLGKFFADDVKAGRMYFGGGQNGFFGIGAGHYNEKAIKEFVDRICTYFMDPYSHHIFLFPFKWDVLTEGKPFDDQLFNKRINLNEFAKKLTTDQFYLIGDQIEPGKTAADEQHLLNKLDSGDPKNSDKAGIALKWKSCQYSFGAPDKVPYNYSEYTYFYDYVQQALYDVEGHGHESVRYFELGLADQVTDRPNESVPPFQNAYLSLLRQYWDKDKKNIAEKEFQIKLTSINMHAFNTGVGILSFFAENYDHPAPDEILLINQLARRIYPEFLEVKASNPLLHETLMATMLAKKVKFIFGDKYVSFCYDEYKEVDSLWDQTRRLPRRIYQFFPSETFSDKADFASKKILEKEVVLIRNVMDDRMFTLCWYGNNTLSRCLRQFDNQTDQYVYESSKFWFALISGDTNSDSPTVQHHRLLRRYIDQFTYARWVNYGTFYGVTRETFVILSGEIEKLNKNFAPPVYQHLQQMYYQMVILCLVQRASVLRFTGEITPLARGMVIVKSIDVEEDLNKYESLAKKVNIVYQHYIDFLNRLYLREITAQIQGDELYNLLQTQMELKADVENLGKQLNELNTHTTTIQQRIAAAFEKEESQTSQRISAALNFLTPVSILTGIVSFIGVDKIIHLDKKEPFSFLSWTWNLDYLFALGIYLIVLIIALFSAKKISNLLVGIFDRKKNNQS